MNKKTVIPSEEQTSVLIVKFGGPGSSEFTVFTQGITYNQTLLAASYLEMKAKSMILQLEADAANRTEQQKLSVPKAEILRP